MDKKSNKKIIVQLVCVILSFALWLYINNVENPVKESTIKNVPVEFVNVEALTNSNLSLVDDEEYTVDVNISGPSNQIYTITKDDFKLKVDLSQYALKQGENTIPVEVVDYPEGINIKNTKSLAVKVKIEACVEKEINLESMVDVNYQSGFSEKSLSIEPLSINISGPKSLVEKASKAVIKGKIDNVSQNIKQDYDIVILDDKGNEINDLELSESSATLEIEVVKGKEVPIKATFIGNLKEGLTLQSSELSLSKITISGDTDKIDKVNFINTSEINLDNINASQKIEAQLEIPEGITIQNGSNKVTVTLNIKDSKIVNKTIYGVKINFVGMDTSKFKYEMQNTCDIVISGTEDEIQNITSSNISVTASLEEISAEGDYDITWTAKLNTSNNASIVSNSGKISVKVKAIS